VKPREEAGITLLLIPTWASPVSGREQVCEGTTGSGMFRWGAKIETIFP